MRIKEITDQEGGVVAEVTVREDLLIRTIKRKWMTSRQKIASHQKEFRALGVIRSSLKRVWYPRWKIP